MLQSIVTSIVTFIGGSVGFHYLTVNVTMNPTMRTVHLELIEGSAKPKLTDRQVRQLLGIGEKSSRLRDYKRLLREYAPESFPCDRHDKTGYKQQAVHALLYVRELFRRYGDEESVTTVLILNGVPEPSTLSTELSNEHESTRSNQSHSWDSRSPIQGYLQKVV